MWAPELVHLPAEHQRRARLAAAGIPRVLVLALGEGVPEDIGIDEDWVRTPVSEQDLAARLENLRLRLERATVLLGGVLRTHRGAITLTEHEATVMAILLDHRGRVVPRAILRDSLGSQREEDRRLHDAVYRLRSRIRPFGLDVLSARGGGYRLGPLIDATPEA